ncbi:hypothetical protein PAHAL_2G018100 [Panicum hallii]|uniref:Uncharacterized protein n=1 Tax=Panicum hallii TaxID=206008 RepID=A0A2S3GVI2_9POAL|nr:hypothetical protein PAHAL_2G018100 [Panicum hallii]
MTGDRAASTHRRLASESESLVARAPSYSSSARVAHPATTPLNPKCAVSLATASSTRKRKSEACLAGTCHGRSWGSTTVPDAPVMAVDHAGRGDGERGDVDLELVATSE